MDTLLSQYKVHYPMVVKDIIAEELAVAARESLSSYCYTECKAYCCRHGYLLLTAKEVELMQDTQKEGLLIIPVEMEVDDRRFVFDLGSRDDGCTNLQKYQCMIHKNPARPKACKEFPLFIWKDKTIMVTHACPAVKENMLYPYLAEFKRMGYKIIYKEGNN